MATIYRFEDLDAWKIARELTRDVYRITQADGFSRDFALKNQIRKASVSVMSNIAEGFERDGNREFCNFLSIGKGSAGEVRSQLYVALDQEYVSRVEFDHIYSKAQESGRVIAGLSNYLKQSGYSGNKFRR
ncbi:MAG: four helix bundle protein [Acidobacteria bacterium]|nr:MAG: four helix bundle protein [Acidobacteriota bacterium]